MVGKPGDWVKDLAYGAGVFVAVTGTGTSGGTGKVFWSPDGEVWAEADTAPGGSLYGVAFGGGRFVAMGAGRTIRSPLVVTNDTRLRFRSNETFRLEDRTMLLTVEAPYGREVRVEASVDLVNWKEIARDLCERGEFEVYDEGAKDLEQRFYRAWQAPPGWVPPPLEDWRVGDSMVGMRTSGLAYGHGVFVSAREGYLGGVSRVYVSSNGADWQLTREGPGNHLRRVSYGMGRFFGYDLGRFNSPDGQQWESRWNDAYQQLDFYRRHRLDLKSALVWRSRWWGSTERMWVDLSQSWHVGWEWWTSADALTWVSNKVDQVCQGGAVAGGNGVLVAVHSSGKSISVSEDGLAWQTFTNENWPKLEGLTYGNG
ncbi:MAG: hypothetical protein FJ387_30295, partial [Verrucomicrobia bacterium]|nr:hypothetical protein [Verrucomicrobiota bacterium]